MTGVGRTGSDRKDLRATVGAQTPGLSFWNLRPPPLPSTGAPSLPARCASPLVHTQCPVWASGSLACAHPFLAVCGLRVWAEGGLMAVVSRGVQVVVAETATRVSSHFRSGGHGQTLSRTVARVADARRPSGGGHLGASQCCGRDARPRSAADASRRGTWRVGGWLRPVSLSPSLTGVFRMPSGGLPLPVPPVLSGPLEGQLALPLDEGRVTLSLGRAVLSPSHSAPRLLCSQPQGRLEHPPCPILGYAEFPACVPCGLLALSSKAACWALPAMGCEA